MSKQTQQLELKREIALLLEELEKRNKYNKISTLFPDTGPLRRELYAKHILFMNKGSEFAQRAFIAANRVGKTFAGAFEVACHLTGNYPDWWEGKRFTQPILAWVAGVTNDVTRDVLQKELLGPVGEFGTGMIPQGLIKEGSIIRKQNSGGAIDTIRIKHASGGYSTLQFKTYEQGRTKFQGDKVQVIWLDEEPKEYGIFSECNTRTANPGSPDGNGIIILTFTPLFGISDVIKKFFHKGLIPANGLNPDNPYSFVVSVEWEDVPHLDEEWKKSMIASYMPHELEARTKGIPCLGQGAIYKVPESEFVVKPFTIPEDWQRSYGFDVGWNRTAAVFCARNPNTNQWFLYQEYYVGEERPAMHAASLRAFGANWIPGAIDPASNNRNSADGTRMLETYWREGLTLYPADNSVDTGIQKVHQMLETGQLKVFNTCEHLIGEYRQYHRDEKGKIVKKDDHLMDAMRYWAMSGIEIAKMNPALYEDDLIQYSSGASGKNEITGY